MATASAHVLCSGLSLDYAGLASGSGRGTTKGHLKFTSRRCGLISVRSAAKEIAFENDERTSSAGDDTLSRIVRFVISKKPLFRMLRQGAKKVIIRTAESSGIPWQKMVRNLKASDVYAEKEFVENVDILYPDYYKANFHWYEDGNLSWEAAFEVEPATMAIMKRAFPSIDSVKEAEETLRYRWLREIDSHHTKFSTSLEPKTILDVGCSTGISTRYLCDHFPEAQVIGLDLSPYFLAVALCIQKQEAANSSPVNRQIHYLHANAEDTGLPSESFDIISCAFVLHECPRYAAVRILREARRLLRPGGTVAFVDIEPKSAVLQNLPPALAALRLSTEPWMDEYYKLELEEELQSNGFNNVMSSLISPRHTTWTASAV